ncbi:phage tail protein [Limosilactobacillus mucosae]|uniref:Phage tail protein n=1 Tax=Limosilactobacillus mucosae TaxID=97478 RepID=A0AAJ1MAS1_LIMMU|nr:major tail protein [Limosilactobacillus mucosae]MDC2830065.1 phage tail protein [Limosilactobacillus mucosae]MDC2837522.1 phage tail protein [Limosilactobacillus mucosae]MDC2853789.1 phage tail protein [Limosilactobacillus mucosae]
MATTPAKLAKFGCSSFEYGVVGADDLVQTTRKVPGLSEVKIELTDEMKTLAADDGPYLVLSGGITETKETINIYDIDSDTKKDFYGIEVVNGIERYAKNIMPNYVATMFKTKLSNGKNVWFALLKGMFSLPGISSKTQDGTPDPEADEIEGSFVPRGDADSGTILLIGREDNPEFKFDVFHAMVFPKTADEATGKVTSGS